MRDFPRELATNNAEVKHLHQEELLFRQKNYLVATVWQDVHFLSTQSNPVRNKMVIHKQCDGMVIQVRCSSCKELHNKNMGGADLHDQMRRYYAIKNNSRRWWRYLLWFCGYVSVVKCLYFRAKVPEPPCRPWLDFRTELAKNILRDFSNRGRTAASGQVEGGHWPITFRKGQYKRSLKWKGSTFCRMGCQQRNKCVCLPCFRITTVTRTNSSQERKIQIRGLTFHVYLTRRILTPHFWYLFLL